MTPEEFAAYREEVRRLGKPPKPVVVIRDPTGGYLIVDGEHAWRASMDVGLAEVPCEVIQADTLEAMRQTLARNHHGKNDPLLEGRVYERMMEEGKLAIRALARELGVTDGTIRNHLKYVEAAGVRNRYAPADADRLIGGLSIEQVKAYLALPEDKRDEWLDSGASLKEAEQRQSRQAAEGEATDTDADDEADAEEPGDGGDASAQESEEQDHEDEEGSSEQETPAASDTGRPAGRAKALEPTSDREPAFDKGVLDELEDSWKRANRPTREKFLAGALAEPPMLAVARRMIKQGS
jgi:ParB-like chromosome segregation protein Spo0J